MTREQAETLVLKFLLGKHTSTTQAAYVDTFVALGMLHLEAPRSIEDRIEAAAMELKSDPGILSSFLRCVDKAGLKIVDK